MKRSSPRRNRGFTLIEVLLVLVILVVLASLAVVNIISAQNSANIKAAKVQVMAFDTALQEYFLEIGAFPSNGTGLYGLVRQPPDIPDPTKWRAVLDKDIPADPWGAQYQYAYPGQHNGDLKPDVWTINRVNGAQIGNWEGG